MDRFFKAFDYQTIDKHSVSFSLAFIASIIICIIMFKRVMKFKKLPQDVQAELDYADYLKWAAENGHTPHFKK
jgi:hypothetical protein